MTFTSVKANNTKNWSADTCYAILDSITKTLTITGQFATGRTDIPYQAMVITIKNFTAVSTIVYLISDAYFEDIFTVNGQSTRVRTTMVLSLAQSFVNAYDQDKSLLKGSFIFEMTSHPPDGNDFNTNVTNGKFEAAIASGINLAVSPGPIVKTNAGNKINFNLYTKNFLSLPVIGADVYVTDTLAKIKDMKVGVTSSTGQYVYTVDVPKDCPTNQYIVSFYVRRIINGVTVTTNKVDRTLDVSSRYWVYNCANTPLMTFDAGAGNEFKSDDPLPTISATGKIILNDVITCDGKVTIDPRPGIERLTGNYNMYIDGVNISGTNQQLFLQTGIGMAFNCANFLKWDTPGIIKTKIGGIEFSLDELGFADLNFAKAVKFKVTAQWGNLYKDNCKTNSNQPEFSSLSGGLTIANEDLAGVKVEGFEISATNLSTAMLPGFCVDNVTFSYDPVADSWKLSTAAEFSKPNPTPGAKNLFEGKAKASVTITNGRFDAFLLEGKSNPGMVIPDVPFTWNGLRIAVSGCSKLGTWKGVSAELAGFFLSDDGLVKNKIPWLSFILGDNSAVELEIVGNVALTGPKITGTVNARMFACKTISVTNKWQVLASGNFGLDFTNGIEFGILNGSFNALHFGAPDYVLTIGSGYKDALSIKPDDISYFWNSGSTIVRIPDVPSDPVNSAEFGPFLKFITYLKGLKVLPRTLGTASGSMMLSSSKGLEYNCMVDVTTSGIPIISSYGSLSMKAGIKTNGAPYMRFGGAFPSIFSSATKRKLGNDITLKNSNNGEMIQANPLDTFEVTNNMKRVFVMLTSTGQLSASTLITPNGEKITGTKPDSSVILFASDDGTFAQWSIIGPETGNWVLQFANPAPTDSVYIFSLNKDRSFDVTAKQSGKNVTVNWDGSGYLPDDYVDIFIDPKDNNFGGKYIGRANAGDGNYIISLTDSLPDCSYYVYANRIASGTSPVTKYASGQFSVQKTWLPAPTNIMLVSNQYGDCQLTFVASQDTNISRYGVYVIQNGQDSLIALAYPDEMPINFNCDTSLIKTLYVVSLNDEFFRGCPAMPQSITVDVPEENPLQGIPHTSDFSIFPNPSSGSSIIYLNLPVESNIKLSIYDFLGKEIKLLASGIYEPGILKFEWDGSAVPSGIYFVRVIIGNEIKTKTLILMK
jgi:hypothetical protein